MTPIRTVLVGAGRWGQRYIATLRELRTFALRVVVSQNPETARSVPEGCEVVTDWRRAIERGDIDAAIIATPPRLHAEILASCLDRGLPAIVEKPLCLSSAEARLLAARAT